MTADQLNKISVGDRVRLRESRGRVTQCTERWFMVSWTGGDPEVIRRRPSILTGRLELEQP